MKADNDDGDGQEDDEGRNDEVEVVGVKMKDDDRGDNDEGGRVEGNHEVEMRDAINDSNNGDDQEDSDEGRDDGVGVVGVKMREDCDDGDRVDEARDKEIQRDEAQEDDEGRDAKEVQEEGGMWSKMIVRMGWDCLWNR